MGFRYMWTLLSIAAFCAAKSLNHAFDEKYSAEVTESMNQFKVFVDDLLVQLTATDMASVPMLEDESDENTHPTDNFLYHILDTIKKGHATTENFTHWTSQLEDLRDKGQISQETFERFVHQFNSLTSNTDSPSLNDHCCLFG